MKNLKQYLIAAVISVALSLSTLSAQTMLTNTTLSTAVAANNVVAPTVTVASATGIVAGSTLLFVDNEGMFVNSVSGTTLAVTRGYFGGRVAAHASGALVWIGSPFAFGWTFPGNLSGSCTRTNLGINNNFLPIINTDNGNITDCVGGQLVTGSGSYGNFFRVSIPPIGAVAYTGVGTSTAIAAATSMYCTELDVQASKYVTGLGVLNGATVGTDKHLAILYDGTGNLIANSAVAGATSAGVSTWQTFAFTTPYYLVGPAKYYACLQSNGTTDNVHMVVTGTQDNITTKAVTAQVFGTIAPTFTVPTTFTTVVGPYWELY